MRHFSRFLAVFTAEAQGSVPSTGGRARRCVIIRSVDKTPFTILGAIFVLLGLLGFVSNPLIGTDALFAADALHNLIHLLFGAAFLAIAAWSRNRTALWLKLVGGALFLFGLAGILSGGELVGAIATNGYSDWFHLIVGAIVFASAL